MRKRRNQPDAQRSRAREPRELQFKEVERTQQDSPKEEPWESPEPPFEMPEAMSGKGKAAMKPSGVWPRSFEEVMADLDPVGWWRLGEQEGHSATDWSAKHIRGLYLPGDEPAHLGEEGAIRADSNTAAGFNPVDGNGDFIDEERQYVEVPDHKIYSLTRANDNFNRDYPSPTPDNPFMWVPRMWGMPEWTSSWGPADGGGEWTADVSTGPYYRCQQANRSDDKEGTPVRKYDGDNNYTGDGNLRHQYGYAEIDQRSVSGTFQQHIDTSLKNCDVQVRASWDAHPGISGEDLKPLALVARLQDSDSSRFYRAELRERNDRQLDLRISRGSGDDYVKLAEKTDLGVYEIGDRWYVRFQVNGSTLRAKAWKMAEAEEMADEQAWIEDEDEENMYYASSAQPVEWTLECPDTSGEAIDAGGYVAIRSSNSGSGAHPIVRFERFRVQTVGFTVHAWMRPDELNFDVPAAGSPYIYWLGKGEESGRSGQQEFAFRFYSEKAELEHEDRVNRISAYAFNLSGDLGAGSYSQQPVDEFHPGNGPQIIVGHWYQVIAVFDPGDALDVAAGVTLYVNGRKTQGPEDSKGSRYSHPEYRVFPKNGGAPLRFATQDKDDRFFTGGLDEIAIFSRAISLWEVRSLFLAARGINKLPFSF